LAAYFSTPSNKPGFFESIPQITADIQNRNPVSGLFGLTTFWIG